MTAAPEALEIRKPLRIGDLLAASVRIYGARPISFLATGLIQGCALIATVWLPFAADLVIVALSFGVAYGVVARLVVGDSIEAAGQRTLGLLPVVAFLASFAAQTHVGFAAVAATIGFGTLVLMAAWQGPGWWRARELPRGLVRHVGLAALVTLVLWTPPIVDALAPGGGRNLQQLARSFAEPADPVAGGVADAAFARYATAPVAAPVNTKVPRGSCWPPTSSRCARTSPPKVKLCRPWTCIPSAHHACVCVVPRE